MFKFVIDEGYPHFKDAPLIESPPRIITYPPWLYRIKKGGYPELGAHAEEKPDFHYPFWVFRMDELLGYNDGYPYLKEQKPKPKVTEVKQYDYISVYASNETDFKHNGLSILLPTECTITEELNGTYELSLRHPFDDEERWQFIRQYSIIKAEGQLFRIYRRHAAMTSDGIREISAEGMHVFYDLNFYFIRDARPFYKSGQPALEWIMGRTYKPYSEKPPFKVHSDIEAARTAYYEKMSVTEALIGADNSFVSRWGGELKRDNFDITINARRGKEDAFQISYGVDMTEIEEEIDLSDYCTRIYWEGSIEGSDNTYRGVTTLSRTDVPNVGCHIMKCTSFKVSQQEYDANPKIFVQLAQEYLINKCSPLINYTVSFVNLKDYELYNDFIDLQSCELGDCGYVYNESLGISTYQQVTKKEVNAITGEVISIQLGSCKRTFTRDVSPNGTGSNSGRNDIISNEISKNNSWNALGAAGYSWQTFSDRKITWNDLKAIPWEEEET